MGVTESAEAPRPPLPADFVSGNYFDKYRSRSPIHRAMLRRFVNCAKELVALANPRRVLEVGCAAGELAGELLGPAGATEQGAPEYLGTDVSADEIAEARARYPGRAFETASVYELPAADGAYDLVIACEVLEHLEDPARALREIERVGCGHVLVSVPWEPVWRLLNVARGKYLSRLGNTPGHIQHLSRRAVRRLVADRFDIVAERRPLPWTMLLAQRRSATTSA
jgi:2-polyprenyl-3-methyl-5-hydroxy-6-metoxy-1,4-benzoquinol methylase